MHSALGLPATSLHSCKDCWTSAWLLGVKKLPGHPASIKNSKSINIEGWLYIWDSASKQRYTRSAPYGGLKQMNVVLHTSSTTWCLQSCKETFWLESNLHPATTVSVNTETHIRCTAFMVNPRLFYFSLRFSMCKHNYSILQSLDIRSWVNLWEDTQRLGLYNLSKRKYSTNYIKEKRKRYIQIDQL